MRRKFLKTFQKTFLFAFIFWVAFSNTPFNFLIGALDFYIKTRNIVDGVWLAPGDKNVIDKFASYRNFAKKVKIAEAVAASQGDGKLFYSISGNTTPQTRDYVSASNSFNTAVSTVAGSTAIRSVVRASPTKDEFIAAYVSGTGVLQVMCYNGTSWSNEWSVTVGGTGADRRFDAAYETSSGDVIVAYSRNAAATNAVDYRTKAGTAGCGSANWAAAASMPTTVALTTGMVHWVKAAWDKRAAQNLISVIWADANQDLGASIWSGTAFGNFPTTAQMEQSLEFVTAAQDVEDFDVEYESTSGDVMMVWGNSAGANGTNGGFYNVCTGGTSTCTWGTRTAMPTILDDVTHLNIAADPNSDSILFGAIGNAGSDLSRGVWSGTAWTNTANADTTGTAPTAGTKFVAVGWLNNGATNRGVLVYYDSAATNVGWQTVNGTTWTAQTDWAPTPVFGTQRQYKIEVDPFNKDRLMFLVGDANSDVFAKRLIMDAAGAFTWTNADGGAALEANGGSASYDFFDFAYNRFIPAPSQTLTIGVTAGSKTANLNSGDTSQYANTTSCSGAATCAAFTLSLNTGSETVTSIKITETGTADATNNLANLALFYDTDGNYSNGVTGQYGSTVAAFTAEAATVSGSLAVSAGTTYYFYVRLDLVKAGVYPSGGQTVDFQIAATGDVTVSGASTKTGPPVTLAGTTTVRPQITGYTNSTEAGLNYAALCAECGTRIGFGSGFRQTVVISGYGFGADPGLGSRDTATNKVEVVGAATTMFADDGSANTNVSAWSNTSVTIRTDTSIVGNADTDWGANFGGAAALKVTAGGQAAPTNLNFYIFPQITSIAQPSGLPADSAREYDSGDTDGVITLNGARFGTAQTGGWVRILGCDSVTCSSPTGSATTTAWDNTSITVQVPTVIADNINTGSVAMRQGTGSNNKTHTFGSTFRVLPRITGFTPSGAAVGDAVTVNGNHFCQGASCPSVFDANNKVTFNSGATSTVFTAWTYSAVTSTVPIGAITGNATTTSNGYDSNGKSFTVYSNTPSNPTALGQFKDGGLTQSISVGGYASSTPVYLLMTMEVLGISGGTLYPQIEYKSAGTAFACSGGGGAAGANACAAAVEGTGKAGPGPATSTVSVSPSDGDYHWQARVCHNKSGTHTATCGGTGDYAGNWASFGGNPEPSGIDFTMDTTAPTVVFTPTDTCAGGQSNLTGTGVTINWSFSPSDLADGQVEYSVNSDLSGSTNQPSSPASPSASHSIALSGLNFSTTYYYKVKSRDNAGNLASRPSAAPYCSFTTLAAQPAKTAAFYAFATTSVALAGATASSSFAVHMPENSTSTISAFLELTGVTLDIGTNSVQIWVNSQAAKTYSIPTNRTLFRIVYKIENANLNTYPATNVIYVNPSLDTYVVSSRVKVTYSYAP